MPGSSILYLQGMQDNKAPTFGLHFYYTLPTKQNPLCLYVLGKNRNMGCMGTLRKKGRLRWVKVVRTNGLMRPGSYNGVQSPTADGFRV